LVEQPLHDRSLLDVEKFWVSMQFEIAEDEQKLATKAGGSNIRRLLLSIEQDADNEASIWGGLVENDPSARTMHVTAVCTLCQAWVLDDEDYCESPGVRVFDPDPRARDTPRLRHKRQQALARDILQNWGSYEPAANGDLQVVAALAVGFPPYRL
jgi:hypothetical protein